MRASPRRTARRESLPTQPRVGRENIRFPGIGAHPTSPAPYRPAPPTLVPIEVEPDSLAITVRAVHRSGPFAVDDEATDAGLDGPLMASVDFASSPGLTVRLESHAQMSAEFVDNGVLIERSGEARILGTLPPHSFA